MKKTGHPARTDPAIIPANPVPPMAQKTDDPTHDDIAALAQKFWEEEGQPEGKAEEHWQRAEEQLRQSEQSDAQAQFQAA